jgi:hypothetical protein
MGQCNPWLWADRCLATLTLEMSLWGVNLLSVVLDLLSEVNSITPWPLIHPPKNQQAAY